MFDIAWSELFVIVVVALVVVGPKDLPKLMRTAGQWAGRARAMADQFRRSFDDMARQAELDELRSEVNRLKHETTAAAEAEVNSALYDTGLHDTGLPDRPFSSVEDVGAAPPKLDEATTPDGTASPAPAPATDPTPATEPSAKLAEPATGSG
jgi:sec-independent protein translocase protein TatB